MNESSWQGGMIQLFARGHVPELYAADRPHRHRFPIRGEFGVVVADLFIARQAPGENLQDFSSSNITEINRGFLRSWVFTRPSEYGRDVSGRRECERSGIDRKPTRPNWAFESRCAAPARREVPLQNILVGVEGNE